MSRSKPSILNSRKNNLSNNQADKNSLQSQLEAALQQITLLKEENAALTSRVKELEEQDTLFLQQQENLKLLNEQLSFRQEQQTSMSSIIMNYEQINSQLTEKLHELQAQLYSKSLPSTAEVTLIQGQSFDTDQPSSYRVRNSRRGRSDSNQKRENHAITPKTQVKFALSHFLDEDILCKKKVFV